MHSSLIPVHTTKQNLSEKISICGYQRLIEKIGNLSLLSVAFDYGWSWSIYVPTTTRTLSFNLYDARNCKFFLLMFLINNVVLSRSFQTAVSLLLLENG